MKPLRWNHGPFEELAEVLAGVALLDLGDLLGRAGGQDRTAAGAALGAQVDDPVRGLDDIQVALDHDDRVATFGKVGLLASAGYISRMPSSVAGYGSTSEPAMKMLKLCSTLLASKYVWASQLSSL